MTSVFHGPVDAGVAIPAPHCGPGGTMNFNFGSSRPDRQKQKPAPFSTVPFAPDPDFVDRPEILTWVRDKCTGPGARAALVGLGGVGKSQLAIQYAHSIRDADPQTFVFWVHASTPARFEDAYRDMADRLELPGRNEPKANVLRLVSDWLRDEANGQWLMVVDNVDHVETFFRARKRRRSDAASAPIPLAAYLPQSRKGAILVTSRSKDAASRLVGGYNKTREVLAMDEGEGLQLLRNKLRDPPTQESAVDLLHALDCIPLAITQSAAYINRRARMTIARYLDESRRSAKRRESLLNWDAGELRRDESASNSVVTTWQMSFEQIRRERPSAADLLSLMSFFNPQGIPESTLRAHSRETIAEDEADAEVAFDEDLDILQAYSLVSMTADKDTCEMHALVQFCTRVWLSSFNSADQWQQRFVELMAQELPDGMYENWARCQQLLPHVEPLFDLDPAADEALKPWAQVLTNAAWYLWRRGNYRTAQQIAAKALAASESSLGVNNPQTMNTTATLALVLQDQGMYKEAEKLTLRALAGYENALGKDHTYTLTILSNLALVLQSQGYYTEAEELNREALAMRENSLGERHPDTLRSKSNLALVLQCQGNYEEAKKLNQQALEGREKELGRGHPDTLLSMNNLAGVLQALGRFQEAEKLNQKVLAGREDKLGERHPDTLRSMNNLALVLQYQGKYKEAEKLSRQALQGREKELGVCHPDTLSSMDNLAGVLQNQGKYKEAEKLNRQALEGWEKELGMHHPDTLLSMNNLAHVLLCQGETSEAEKLNREVLARQENSLGERHPDTLRSMNNLALVLQYQGRYKEAEELRQQALQRQEKELGLSHPDTLLSTNNLSVVLQKQGKYKEAEKLNRQALEGQEKELGGRHVDTLISAHCLAQLLHRLGRYSEAAELYQRAYDGCSEQLGAEHPQTVACREDLLALQQEAGRDYAAE